MYSITWPPRPAAVVRPVLAALMITTCCDVAAQQAGDSKEKTLPALTVRDTQPAYVEPAAAAATRFEADPLSVPQSSQSIGRALIEDSGAVDVRDVLKLVPSAFAGHTRLAPFASFSWKIRGFDASVTRNGFRQLYFEDVDQSAFGNLERIDIVKGPGAVAYGKEGLGGTIHMVTRRPERQFGASAHVSFGRYNSTVAGADITGAVFGDSGLALRLNGEIERSDSFVDHQYLDRDNASLTATWDRGGPVRAFVMTEYQERRSLPHPGLPVVGTARSNGVAPVARSTYLGEPAFDYLKTWAPLTQAWLEFDIAPGWTISPRYQYFTFNVDQQQMRLRAPLGADPTLIARSGRFNFHERDKTGTFQLELKGSFAFAATKHKLALGYENNRHRWTGDWRDYDAVPAISSLAPTYLGMAPPASVLTTFSGRVHTDEYYLQDLISIGDRLNVLLGARHARLRILSEFAGFVTPDQNDNGNSFQAGASYRVAPHWSVFAGVASGLSIENVVGAVSSTGTPFAPERSRQWELGVKHHSGSVSASLALFELRMQNATTADPANPGFTIQVGEQRSRGVEAEGIWQVDRAWSLLGGVAYLDAEVTRSNDGDVGNRLGNVPHLQANAWTRYRISPQFDAGAGVNYVGDRMGTLANTYELPAYATVDLSFGWQIGRKARAELFLRNLFDKTYFTGNNNNAVYPGEPRNVYARLRLDL